MKAMVEAAAGIDEGADILAEAGLKRPGCNVLDDDTNEHQHKCVTIPNAGGVAPPTAESSA